MKLIKKHIFIIVNIFYLILTGAVSIFGYFHLPDKVATHISLSGELSNRVSKPVYLIGAFIIILILSVLSMTKEKELKIKYLFAVTICVIAHISMIVIQMQ